ncbi:MAG: putative inorganic carbon transporter subunit DabA, partial [Myxococcota bacterium]
MDLHTNTGQLLYLQRLLATCQGWASQFQYIEWQRQLGYEVSHQVCSVEFLGIRLVYDAAVFEHQRRRDPHSVNAWVNQLNNLHERPTKLPEQPMTHAIWQCALEMSYQEKITNGLTLETHAPKPQSEVPEVQMAFCIDVRSEMLRRHLEACEIRIQTIGFAGFFGMPLNIQTRAQNETQNRLPVLIKSAVQAREKTHSHSDNPEPNDQLRANRWMSFFKNIRKGPLSSFVYVELFGLLSLFRFLKQTWNTHIHPKPEHHQCKHGTAQHVHLDQYELIDQDTGEEHTPEQQVGLVAAILGHMGLTENFGRFIFLVGHGAHTTNNAFESVLQCGACGGHAGDMSARILTQLLNKPGIRAGLHQRGIVIPSETRFFSALHETVTDRIHILDPKYIPERYRKDIQRLEKQFAQASEATSRERQNTRSERLDPCPHRRAKNWSETRPEWGLAGNACFIIAPRRRTKQLNLASRAFLHDYDWQNDREYKTLELL